jgi:hypothetical protein
MVDTTGCSVGDVREWVDVPDGAMIRDDEGNYVVRWRDDGRSLSEGWFVKYGGEPASWDPPDGWQGVYKPGFFWTSPRQLSRMERCRWTVVALNLTTCETPAELRQLAEVFETRSAT